MAQKKIKIRYIKSYDFKASLATGVYGGITSTGLISANFFIDRPVIPDSQDVEIEEETGTVIGDPVDHKDGDLVRELQFGTLMDINSAKIIVKWLESKIKQHEEIFKPK